MKLITLFFLAIMVTLLLCYQPYQKGKATRRGEWPRKGGSNKFDFEGYAKFYDSAAEELFAFLNTLGVEWWPTEGTLIGILRYGANIVNLPSFGKISTDTDIDIMIRAESDEDWKKLRQRLTKEIPRLSKFTSCKNVRAANKTETHDKLYCHTEKYINNEEGHIHADIHRYIVNEEKNYAYTKTTPGDDLSYPFQYWGNRIPYRGMITDDNGKLKKAKYNMLTVPCPFNPVEILKHWNDHEYGKGDIRYPYKQAFGETGKFHKFSMDSKDRKYIQDKWMELQKEGFKSFYE